MRRTKWQTWTLLGSALTGLGLAAPIKDNTLSGKIVDWPAGKTGEVRLSVRQKMFGAEGGATLAKGNVDEKGAFSLTLPAAAALDGALPAAAETWKMVMACPQWDGLAWCPAELALKPAARLNLFDLTAYAGEERLGVVKFASAPHADPSAGLVKTYLAHASAPVLVTGGLSFNPLKTEWQAELPAGWSWLSESFAARDATTGQWPVKVSAAGLPQQMTFFLNAQRGQTGFTSRRIQAGSRIGHLVEKLSDGGAAERAGLKVDDLIVQVGDQRATGWSSSLLTQNLTGPPGTVYQLTVQRGAETLTLPLTLLPVTVPYEH